MSAKFVADVGGTNIRLARIDGDGLVDIIKYKCTDFDTLELAIKQYFSDVPSYSFTQGCIGIACPVLGDQVTMTNHTWAFSQKALTTALGLEALFVINDFTAVAHSLPVLTSDQVIQIGEGSVETGGNIAVFGPGTGLGVEHLTQTERGWQTLNGEGGHVDFAPVDETDVVIWRYLQQTKGRASAEEVMSGRGLLNIYLALVADAGKTAICNDPAQVTEKALSGECAICELALNQFCKIMGSFAGNLALNLATTGGVFIGGGIASRFPDFIQKSEFRARFESKAPLNDYVKDIPTFLITEPDHGLLGASAYLKQHTAS